MQDQVGRLHTGKNGGLQKESTRAYSCDIQAVYCTCIADRQLTCIMTLSLSC